MEFSNRLDNNIQHFIAYKKNVDAVEDALEDRYTFVSFNHTYSPLEDNLLREIVQSNFANIEALMAYIGEDEPDIDMPDSCFQEYDFYRTAYIALIKAWNGEKITSDDLFKLWEAFRDLVDSYDGDFGKDDDDSGEEIWDGD